MEGLVLSISILVTGKYRNNKAESVGLHHSSHTPWDDVDAMEINYKLHKYIFDRLDKFKRIEYTYHIIGNPQQSKNGTMTVDTPVTKESILSTVQTIMNNMNKALSAN